MGGMDYLATLTEKMTKARDFFPGLFLLRRRLAMAALNKIWRF